MRRQATARCRSAWPRPSQYIDGPTAHIEAIDELNAVIVASTVDGPYRASGQLTRGGLAVDFDAARKQRGKRDADVHGVGLNHGRRLPALDVGDAHPVEAQRRSRQKIEPDVAADSQLAARCRRRSGFDFRLVLVPVHQRRHDEYTDDEDGDDDGEPVGEDADKQLIHALMRDPKSTAYPTCCCRTRL